MSGNKTKRIAFNYFGGKFTYVDEIIQYFPEHEHFVDVFCGSMAITLNKPPSKIDTANDRQLAQEIITNYGFELPPPSNCTICFWMSDHELIWLYRNLPKDFWYWVKLERNKLNRFRAQGLEEEKNRGVFGELTIIQNLKKALTKYGHWTSEQLEEYKMSHGHCTKSKF